MTGSGIFVLSVCVVALFICILAQIRNEMTLKFSLKRINTVYDLYRESLYNSELKFSEDDLECPFSYLEMMWDLRKWSYNAFFPKGY